MKFYKKNKGITLIALVITIIILLILAGITIVQLTGNGLFRKAKLAEKRTRYENAKEVVNLKLMEIQVNCIENNEEYNIIKIAEGMKQAKDITIEKYYNKETASVKEGVTENTTNLEGIVVSVDEYSEYKFLIGESCEIIGVLEGEVTNTTSMEDFMDLETFEKSAFGSEVTEISSIKFSYELESYENNKFKILIKVTDENGIDTIKFPNGDIQKCNGKEEVGIDYEVDEGVDYIFVAKNSNGNEISEIVNFTKPAQPVFSDVEIGYQTLTLTGVKETNTKITITYDEREEFLNYYSLDNGETWKLYTGPISATGTIKAKSVHKKCEGIYTSSETKLNKPVDAIGYEAFDEDKDNYSMQEVGETGLCKFYIDESCWGRFLFIEYSMIGYPGSWTYKEQIDFYTSDGEIVDSFLESDTMDRYDANKERTLIWEIIPENTSYVVMTLHAYPRKVYNIYLEEKATLTVPIITSEGIKNVGEFKDGKMQYILDLNAKDPWAAVAANKFWFDNDYEAKYVKIGGGTNILGVFKIDPSAIRYNLGSTSYKS